MGYYGFFFRYFVVTFLMFVSNEAGNSEKKSKGVCLNRLFRIS